MGTARVLILIPARFASSRFPGKPLASLLGKSLIQRVYENCAAALSGDQNLSGEVRVVTDDDRIENHVLEFGGKISRIDDDVQSGSERIYLAYERYFKDDNFDFVINVQGDEPLLTGKELDHLIHFHEKSEYDITTIVKKDGHSAAEFTNENRVKAMFVPKNGRCLYFSRSPIEATKDEWYLHIGVYCYRIQALEKFFHSGPGFYEEKERLEQLRALEEGMSIGAVATDLKLAGVDVPEDIKTVEELIRVQSN